MRTVSIEIYKFDELSKSARNFAIEKFREKDGSIDCIYNEAYESVKKFHEIFGTKEGTRSWLHVRDGNLSCEILEMDDARLQKYIWNNFKDDLFKGRYYGVKSRRKINHKRVVSKPTGIEGDYCNAYYSAIFKHNDCVLTGVCYDNILLGPIYDYLESRNPQGDFWSLVKECFRGLEKALEEEAFYYWSEEYVSEELQNYEFYEDGRIYA